MDATQSDKDTQSATFSHNLRTCRDSANLTQEQVSEATGIDVSEISRMENGHKITAQNALRFAALFGVPIGLFYIDPKAPKKSIRRTSVKPFTPEVPAHG